MIVDDNTCDGCDLLSLFKVAKRVYDVHRQTALEFKDKKLEIELESPNLMDYQDPKSVRLSSLAAQLDPEKLRFYLSALADNVVTHLAFDRNETKAVASFAQNIGESFYTPILSIKTIASW